MRIVGNSVSSRQGFLFIRNLRISSGSVKCGAIGHHYIRDKNGKANSMPSSHTESVCYNSREDLREESRAVEAVQIILIFAQLPHRSQKPTLLGGRCLWLPQSRAVSEAGSDDKFCFCRPACDSRFA